MEQQQRGRGAILLASYTESLRSEPRGTGVTAAVLGPGPVDIGLDTSAGFRAGERRRVLPAVMCKSVDRVARTAVDGPAAGTGRVTPG